MVSKSLRTVNRPGVFYGACAVVAALLLRSIFVSTQLFYGDDGGFQQHLPPSESNRNSDTETVAKTTPQTTQSAIKASTTTTLTTNSSWPDDQSLSEWRRKRAAPDVYNGWFANGRGDGELRPRGADRDGPVLDFFVAGFPKCGTTAVSGTLSPVTAMPGGADVCAPVRSTVFYAYRNWPREHGRDADGAEKPLRGSKCPYYVESSDLEDLGRQLPRTRLIVGIRHPVLWFQSFVNQQWYYFSKGPGRDANVTLSDYVDDRLLSTQHRTCANARTKVCVARSRFHLSLLRLGKTPLGARERDLLRSELMQAQRRRNDTSRAFRTPPFPEQVVGVPNHVFLYESGQGKEEYFYRELAAFVRVDRAKLPPLDDRTHQSHGGLNIDRNIQHRDQVAKTDLLDICRPEFDHVRKELLPIAYTLQQWLLRYVVPASREREDLTIPNADAFVDIVRGFGRDPCGDDRLVRNVSDGEYY